MNFLINIVGPTAIGKTALAIQIAQHFDTEIISSDSRQFFKEMCIGTAVPSKEELSEVKHHFIQHKSIFENYSVGDFERETISFLDNFYKKKSIVVMVGGSGLYSNAVLYGLDDFPEVPQKIREELYFEYKNNGIAFLQKKLQKLDPQHYNNMDIHNPQRIIRALEICITAGKSYSSFLNKKNINRNFTFIQIGLTAEREIIYERINKRVEKMLEEGMIQEAQSLYKYKNLNALQTVGYREFFDFFDKKTNLKEAIENVKMNTRRFAKRQLTWYNKSTDIQWFDYETNPLEIINYIENKLF
ncbi:MAG: tRNA (adenosine(37)-N6)-dimethylallyltransferase MiaA [Capnocytophaga sp.]|nr:tRNA (adenosine(37)-N6)-dimethylallyltransferase MiaA [Capnocytophaga sp.]